MPASASEGTTDDSQTRSVSHAPVGRAAEVALELRGECAICRIAVAVRDRRRAPVRSRRAEQLHLPAPHHRAQQRHVRRDSAQQVVEQRAAEMDREAEFGIAVQRFAGTGRSSARARPPSRREIADGLVGVHAEQQGDGMRSWGVPDAARRMAAPLRRRRCRWRMADSVARARAARALRAGGRGWRGCARYSRSKLADGLGRVVVAEPPEPVRALADRELPLGRAALVRVEAAAADHQVEALLGGARAGPRRGSCRRRRSRSRACRTPSCRPARCGQRRAARARRRSRPALRRRCVGADRGCAVERGVQLARGNSSRCTGSAPRRSRRRG